MIRASIFLFLLIVTYVYSDRNELLTEENQYLYDFLKTSADEIYRTNLEKDCFYHNTQPKKDKDLYFTTRQLPDRQDVTFIYNVFCPDAGQLGNHIGAYFNEVACALESGAHYATFQKYPSDIQRTHSAFFKAFPPVVINKKFVTNNSRSEIKVRSLTTCPCHEFCWTKVDAPWQHHIDWLVDVIRKGTALFVESHGMENLTPHAENHRLPISLPAIPDVAVQYVILRSFHS